MNYCDISLTSFVFHLFPLTLLVYYKIKSSLWKNIVALCHKRYTYLDEDQAGMIQLKAIKCKNVSIRQNPLKHTDNCAVLDDDKTIDDKYSVGSFLYMPIHPLRTDRCRRSESFKLVFYLVQSPYVPYTVPV